MATEQEINEARLEALKAEAAALRETPARTVAELAVMILNDKHTATGRNVDAAVTEALAVYRSVTRGLAEPAFWAAR